MLTATLLEFSGIITVSHQVFVTENGVLRTPAISVVNVGMFKKNRKKSKSKIE
jgi:hypothetical protein